MTREIEIEKFFNQRYHDPYTYKERERRDTFSAKIQSHEIFLKEQCRMLLFSNYIHKNESSVLQKVMKIIISDEF